MEYKNLFTNVITSEAKALQRTASLVKEEEIKALANIYEYLVNTNGSLVFSGVGKSGLIGQKIAATFSSLGLPSFFLHATEAMHGDLGHLRKSDALVLISKSGTTEELLHMLPYISVPKERIIALVGDVTSPIARKAGIVINASVEKEACINNLAPTTSTTVALAIGDAMAVLYENIVHISKEKFAMNHPGGLLGKSLSLTVDHLLIKAKDCAVVKETSSLQEALLAMTRKPVGMCIVQEGDNIVGILTEREISRAFKGDDDAIKAPVKGFMNKDYVSVTPKTLASEALKAMESQTSQMGIIPVVNSENLVGVVRLTELLKAGFHSNFDQSEQP